MATRTPETRAKALLSWIALAVAVIIGGSTVAILVAAVRVDAVGEVTGSLVAGGIATAAAIAFFVRQRRSVRETRAAELAAAAVPDPGWPEAVDPGAPADPGTASDPLSR